MELDINNLVHLTAQMFSKNTQKRFNSLRRINDVILALKLPEQNEEILSFLLQFVDESPPTIMVLLDELETLDTRAGGSELQTFLLPLFIKFCQTDERVISLKSLQIIEKVVQDRERLLVQTIIKLLKPKMICSVEIGVILISKNINKFKSSEDLLLELYWEIITNSEPSLRIIACKYLPQLTETLINKQKIFKILDAIFQDVEELPRLLSIKAITFIYKTNPNFALTKLKILFCQGNWRVNLALCQQFGNIQKNLNRFHFKSFAEPAYIKFLNSEDDEVRGAACSAIPGITKYMTHQQAFNSLFPIITKLSNDKLSVKISLSKNILKLIPEFSKENSKNKLLPLVLQFLQNNRQDCFLSMTEDLKNISSLAQYKDFFAEILEFLLKQQNNNTWRSKIEIFDLFQKIIEKFEQKYEEQILSFGKKCLKDRIEALQTKAVNFYTKLFQNRSTQWHNQKFIPLLLDLRDNSNFRIRQQAIHLINQTCQIKDQNLLELYKKIIFYFLNDKVPNIRYLALQTLGENSRLMSDQTQKQIIRLNQDPDPEVREAALKLSK